MKKIIYSFVATAVHIIIPLLLAVLGGFIIGTITGGQWYQYFFWVLLAIFSFISFGLFKKSFTTVSDAVYAMFFVFGEYIETVTSGGLYYIPFGWIKGSKIEYPKGVFKVNSEQDVEYMEKKPVEDDHNNHALHEGFSSSMLFEYIMHLKSTIVLKIDDSKKENIRNLYLQNNGNVFNVESDIVSNVVSDLETTLELIALAFGFQRLKSEPDWNLDDLNKATQEAIEILKENGIRKKSNFKADTLSETLERYGLKLVSVNVDISLDKDAEKAVKDIMIAGRQHQSNILRAITDAEASEIKASQDAKNLKTIAEAEAKAKEKEGEGIANQLRVIRDELIKDDRFKKLTPEDLERFILIALGKETRNTQTYELNGVKIPEGIMKVLTNAVKNLTSSRQ